MSETESDFYDGLYTCWGCGEYTRIGDGRKPEREDRIICRECEEHGLGAGSFESGGLEAVGSPWLAGVTFVDLD
jgi:hypothetical protein